MQKADSPSCFIQPPFSRVPFLLPMTDLALDTPLLSRLYVAAPFDFESSLLAASCCCACTTSEIPPCYYRPPRRSKNFVGFAG